MDLPYLRRMRESPPADRWFSLKNVLLVVAAFFLGAGIVYLYTTFLAPQAGGLATPDRPVLVFLPKSEGRLKVEDALLPKHVRPEGYQLTLKAWMPGYGAVIPGRKNLTFDGVLVARLYADKETDLVTMNAVELNFTGEIYAEANGERISVVEVRIDELRDKVEFKLDRPVTGSFRLSVGYTGRILPGLNGLYQTHYTRANGDEKIAAVTQMEAIAARKMVPNFDEPAWKAKWNVTVIHPVGTSAISNGIELGAPKRVDGDFLESRFLETPAMSSYLLAIAITDFQFREGRTKNGVRFRIWARPEAYNTTDFALHAGIKCLEGLEEFYQVPFPLKKQDMIALPDFEAGAMENWGLITYRETDLLLDEKNYYYNARLRVATVIAHELAHMWFGNLATMSWWTDLWLNEGFATLVENIGVDIISDGSFQMETDFVNEQLRLAMEIDQLASSNPIVNPLEYTNEIDQQFSAIAYKKGASVLKMMQHLVGEEAFKHGVTAYLKKYSYQNAIHTDLFRELDAAVPHGVMGPDGKKLNVTAFALKWTKQMGYPYISLGEHNSSHWKVSQTRYLVNPEAEESGRHETPYNYQWDVPVWYQVGEGEVRLEWLPYEGELFLQKTDEAVVLNVDSYAMARINYDEKGWMRVLEQLKTHERVYTQRTKYRIVKDLFAMAAIDKTDYKTVLELTDYMAGETLRYPWLAFLDEISSIMARLKGTEGEKAAENYLQKLLEPVSKTPIEALVASINSDKAYTEQGHRISQWLTYCHVNEESCSAALSKYFETAFRQPCEGNSLQASQCSRVPPAIRMSVYCQAVKTGDDETFKLMLTKYKTEKLALEADRLRSSLGCTHDKERVNWILNELKSKETTMVRGQDISKMYAKLVDNEVAGPMLADHLYDNWDAIFKRTSAVGTTIVERSVQYLLANIRTEEQMAKFQVFKKTAKNIVGNNGFKKAEQKAQEKIAWVKKYEQRLGRLFEEKTAQL